MGESRKYLRLTLASGSRFGMVDWDGLESCKVFTEAKIEGSTGSSSSFAYSILSTFSSVSMDTSKGVFNI